MYLSVDLSIKRSMLPSA